MTMNDEELFEHLQELVAELPAMQEKGAVLARPVPQLKLLSARITTKASEMS